MGPLGHPKRAHKTPQDGQEGPKGAPKEAKKPPRGAKKGLNEAKKGPRMRKETKSETRLRNISKTHKNTMVFHGFKVPRHPKKTPKRHLKDTNMAPKVTK